MTEKARTETLRQASTFAIVGLVATAVHYVVALVLSTMMPVVWANPFGFMLAFGVSYFGHGRLTFRLAAADRDHKRQLPKFALTAATGFLIGQAILATLRHFTPWPDWQILGLALGVVPAFTFAISRIWVFTVAKQ